MSQQESLTEMFKKMSDMIEGLVAENEKLKEKNAELEKEVSLINSEEMENEEEIAKLKNQSDNFKQVAIYYWSNGLLGKEHNPQLSQIDGGKYQVELDKLNGGEMEQFLKRHNITKEQFVKIKDTTNTNY